MNYFGAPVGAVRASFDELPVFQTVDRGRNRATRQQDLLADLVNRERTFVQKRFENSEVAAAHLQLRDTALRIRLDRPRRLPQHEENMNPTAAAQRFELGSPSRIHNYLDIKILYFER